MIPAIRPCALPPGALLARYAEPELGAYTDAFVMEVPGEAPLAALIEAFYLSAAMRPEALLLRLLFRKPWSGELVRALARGEGEAISAWRVEAREADQILLREVISDKTMSWLMVRPGAGAGPEGASSLIYFGSGILPVGTKADGTARMSVLFAPGLGFHRLYSRVLLWGAARRLRRA